MDFYRNPSAKDVTGWHGPATVADLTRLTRGSIQVKWQGQLLEVTTHSVRHHLGYWVFLAAYHRVQQAHIHTNIWQTIKSELDKMSSGQVIQLGHILHHDQSWKWAKKTATQYQLYNALKFFAENHLHLDNVVSVRVGKGLQQLSKLHGYTASTLLLWKPGLGQVEIVHSESGPTSHELAPVPLPKCQQDWKQVRVVQLLTHLDYANLTETTF